MLELMVVMVILTLAAAAVAPRLGSWGGVVSSPESTTSLAPVARAARRVAVEDAVPVLLVLDRRSGRYWIFAERVVGIEEIASGVLAGSFDAPAGGQRTWVRFTPSGLVHAESSDLLRLVGAEGLSGDLPAGTAAHGLSP